jgi:hypothetical protein
MRLNNFQELERMEMEQREVPSNIKNSIDSQVGFFKFIGNLFELFIPQMVDLFANKMTNNTTKNSSRRYPNQ